MQVSIIDGTISEIIQHSYRLAQNHCCPWDMAMKSNMIDNNIYSSGPTTSGMALRKVSMNERRNLRLHKSEQ